MKKGLVIGLGLLGGIIGLVVISFLWGISINNRMVRLNQEVDTSWAQVQNVYQRRADLVPNLVNTVQGAANFERGTLNEVVQARASVGQTKIDANQAPTDPEQLRKFQAAQDQLSSALSRLLVVVERYPELKANQNFLALQTQLEGTENRISTERGRFNEMVRNYNTYIQQFPAMFIASFRNFKPKPYFQATEGAERPPEVQFDFNKAAPSNP
jgi:LemA protein